MGMFASSKVKDKKYRSNYNNDGAQHNAHNDTRAQATAYIIYFALTNACSDVNSPCKTVSASCARIRYTTAFFAMG
jgi:hypothetical protein